MTETATVESLVAAARGGDRAAFGELHSLHAPMVHGLLLSWVPPGEAEDLTQEVFLSAMQKLASLRDDSAFGGWLATIARNRARDHYRRSKRWKPLPDDLPQEHPPHAEAGEVLARIRDLPAAYREPLVLRLVEGMTGPEIAERMGMTPGSVRVNLHRGMKLLRQSLGMEKAV